MKSFLLTLLCLMVLGQVQAQELNKSFTDSKGNTKLLGQVSYKRLLKKPFKEWYLPNEKAYSLSEDSIQMLKQILLSEKTDSITIFLGTWCGDSKREVPRFTKMLKAIDFDLAKLKIICVDNQLSNYKQSPDGEEQGQNIHRVPTFIFHKEQKEVGRIVESPVVSFSSDVLKILNGEDYKPNYQGVTLLHKLLSENSPNYLETNSGSILAQLKELVTSESELNTYSYTFMSNRQLGLAKQVLMLNSQLFPQSERPYRNLAWVMDNMGDYENSLAYYKKALEVNPENEHVKSAIAYLEAMLKNS